MPLGTGDVCLLSLEGCRALLPSDCNLSDEELERLRDELYTLAGVTLESFCVKAVRN